MIRKLIYQGIFCKCLTHVRIAMRFQFPNGKHCTIPWFVLFLTRPNILRTQAEYWWCKSNGPYLDLFLRDVGVAEPVESLEELVDVDLAVAIGVQLVEQSLQPVAFSLHPSRFLGRG